MAHDTFIVYYNFISLIHHTYFARGDRLGYMDGMLRQKHTS